MSHGITVKELLQICRAEVASGHGDKVICISSDDEGNEYHTLYYGFTDSQDELDAIADMGMFHDDNDPKGVVILG